MATVQEKDTASLQFIEVLNNLGAFKTAISLLQKDIRTLEKNVKRKIKTLEKEAKKK